jgi:integrase
MEHVGRPRVVGGVRPSSIKRYRAVLDKFEQFLTTEGINTWNQVTREVLQSYAAHLDDGGYSYATEYLELTTLKQAIKWLVEQNRLPAACLIRLPLSKPEGTTTYCWHEAEVAAMLRLCRTTEGLGWLGDVIVALACTGLRISELASLRGSDIDGTKNLIKLTDESRRARKDKDAVRRQTKSGRSRSFPIHQDLRQVLEPMTPGKEGTIFRGPLGGRLKPDTVRRILVRDVLTPLQERFPAPKGEPGFKDGRLHSFRHYFCSTCSNSGIPEEVVMRWLGHRDSDMVRHYYHLHDEEAQRQMKRLKFLGEAGGSGADGDGS